MTSQQTTQIPTTSLNTNPTASDIQTTTGGWSPRINLALPPATRDLKPDIDLVYHPTRHNGFIGGGWGLAFESSIEARSATGGAPIMGGGGSATNVYYLNGHKLVRMGDGTYRTQQDSHTIYRTIESGGVVVGWTGKRNGITMAWGQVHPFDADNNAITYQDERVVWTGSGVGVPTTAQGDHPIRWSISSITDPHDNDIRFRYRIPLIWDLVPGHSSPFSSYRHVPDTIEFNGHPSDRSHTFVITFDYEARDDVRAMVYGVKRLEAFRLSDIRITTASGELTHHYAMGYDDAHEDTQSLLMTVKRLSVAGDGQERILKTMRYHDKAISWSTTNPNALNFSHELGPDEIPDDSDVSIRVESSSMVVDVNGDSLPDVIAFNQTCGGASYDCKNIRHNVFINRTNDPNATHDFVLDSERTYALSAFLGSTIACQPVASRGKPIQYSIVDLNGDGLPDLVRGDLSGCDAEQDPHPNGDTANSLLLATDEGWNLDDIQQPTWLDDGDEELKEHHLVDLNGDGLPDLVGQHQADLNRGPDASSFFTLNPVTMVDLQEPMATLDPDTHPSASPEYDTAKASGCMSRDVTEMIIGDWLGTYTVAEETLYHPNPLVDGSGRTIMSPAEWVWRHTQHSDINGDGFADRIFNVPFLEEDSIYAGLYRINTFDCGHFTQIYLGDGRGGFIATGHGLDDTSTNPIDTEHKEQVKVASGPHTTVTYTTLRNGFSAVDLNRNGRPEVTLYPQATGVGTTHPIVLHNQGLTPSTAGFGCGLTVGTGCPDSGDATLPIRSLGLAPISHQYRTLTDINGDGAVDAFELYWDNSTKAYSVSYFPSEHQQPQNRLVAIQGPQGGETSVVWTTSAQTPDNTIPLNVDVIASRTQHGTTLYSYHNAYRNAEGKFAGFGRVVTKPPTGAVSIETFHIYDAFGVVQLPVDRFAPEGIV
ncbi:MAG: hypothetical protein AAFX99_14960, partial [Myxococcota bacterium]